MSRRAAIISGGWTAIVVADHDDAPTLGHVLAESFEVGRIVVDEFGEKRREWSEADVDLAARRAMQRFIDLKVQSVVIEWATSKTSKAHALARAVQEACIANNIAWTYAKRWRLWNAAAHRDWVARRLAEGFRGWPSEAFTVTRDCGVMLLESIATARPVQVPLSPKEDAHVPNLESSDAQVEAAPVTPRVTELKRRGRKKPAAPVVLLPRTAGIDPGSYSLGLVITEGTMMPVQLVHKVTLQVGEKVPLKRPRKIKSEGKTILVRTRHSLTAAMAKALADKVVARLLQYRVTRLAIEHVESVHMNPKLVGAAASSITTSLIRTSWLDILIGERAEAQGIEVHRVSATTWRARVAGRSRGKRGGAGAELIPEAVASRIQGWPHDADEHERDAAGVNLWLVLPPPELPPLAEKKTRASRIGTPHAPREPGRRPASYYARLERLRTETTQARVVTGCACDKKGRHRTGCPLGDTSLSAMERKLLTALTAFFYPSGLSKQKLLTAAGYRYGASVTKALEGLRRDGRVAGESHALHITSEGRRALETG